jgi:hypothetical protein
MTYSMLKPLSEMTYITNQIVGARDPSPLRRQKWIRTLEKFEESFFTIHPILLAKRGKV